MKRLIAAALLLVFIAVSCVVGQFTIGQSGKKLKGFLTEATNLIEQEKYDEARAQLKKAEDEYTRQEWKLSFFIYHGLVEELGEQLAALPALANEEGRSDLISQIDSTKVKIVHIIRDNRFSLSNIF